MKKYLIGAFAGICALLGIYLKGKKDGKKEEKAETNEKVLDDVKKVSVARNNKSKLNSVRKKYTKK